MSDSGAPQKGEGDADVPSDPGSAVEPADGLASPRPASAGPDRLGQPGNADRGSTVDADSDASPQDGHGELDDRVVEPEVVEEIAQSVAMLLEASSGPVQPARELYEYTHDHQERLFRIAEAGTSDESKRRDKIVDSSIATTKRSGWVQPVLFLICVGLSALSFLVFNNKTAGTVFLGYPVLLFLSGIRWNFRRRRKDD